MRGSQYFFIHFKNLIDLLLCGWIGIVIDGKESSLIVVSIALLVGVPCFEAVWQGSNAVIVYSPDNAPAFDDFVRDGFDCIGELVKV